MSKYKYKRSDLIERLEAVLPPLDSVANTAQSDYARGLFSGYHDGLKTVLELFSEVE